MSNAQWPGQPLDVPAQAAPQARPRPRSASSGQWPGEPVEGGADDFAAPAPPSATAGFLRRPLDAASDWLFATGRREENTPEIGAMPMDGVPFMGGLKALVGDVITPDVKAQADILAANIPGATQSIDAWGNPIIERDGQRYYVNKPGFSSRDVSGLIGQVAQFAPVSRLAGAGGMLARMGRVGAASGALSIGQDIAAGQLGSEQGIDLPRAGISAVAGGLSEGIQPLVNKVAAWWRPTMAKPDGTLTPEGIAMAQRAGVDPLDLTPDAIKRINEIMAKMGSAARADADQATAAIRTGQTGQFGIGLTKGQASGNADQLAREEAMRHGARGGDAAYQVMRRFDDAQNAEIRRAADDLAVKAGRGRGSMSESEVGGSLYESLKEASRKADARVRKAYDAVDWSQIQGDAKSLSALVTGIDDALSERTVDPLITPMTLNRLKNLHDTVRQMAGADDAIAKAYQANPVAGKPPGKLQFNLKVMDTYRKGIQAAIDAAGNPTDRGNLLAVKRTFDDWLDNSIANGLMSGDETMLESLKKARALRADYGRKFQAGGRYDDIGRVIERIVDPKAGVSNQEVANLLYGSGEIGANAMGVRAAKKIEQIFGKDSAEFATLKQGAVIRMIWGPRGEPLGDLPKKTIIERMNRALNGRQADLTRELFTAGERRVMRNFIAALDATRTPDRLRNPSGTSYALARMTGDLFRRLFGIAISAQAGPAAGIAADAAISNAPSVGGGRAARDVVAGFLPRPASIPWVTGGVAGAANQQGAQ